MCSQWIFGGKWIILLLLNETFSFDWGRERVYLCLIFMTLCELWYSYHLRNYTNSPNYFTKFQLFYKKIYLLANSRYKLKFTNFRLQIKNIDLQDSFFSFYMYFIVYTSKIRFINLIILFPYLLLYSNYI
jgi:hypothetical protein